MTGINLHFFYTLLLTTIAGIALAWLSISAPCLEIGFFGVSAFTALSVSLYAWYNADRINQSTMLIIYCLLACSIILAVTSVVDLADFSILGKHNDARSGALLGGLLAFCLLTIISARCSKRFPEALAWGSLVACIMGFGFGSSYSGGLKLEYSVLVAISALLMAMGAFIALCRCKGNLTDSQYLSILSVIVVFIVMNSSGARVDLLADLASSLVILLAGVLFFFERRNAPFSVQVAGSMLFCAGVDSIFSDSLHKGLGVNEILAGIPSLLTYLNVLAWIYFRKLEIPRGFYWVSLITFGLSGVNSVIPEAKSDTLLPAIIGAMGLFLLACIYYSPPIVKPTRTDRLRNSCTACGLAFALAVTLGYLGVSLHMLVNNLGPARFIAKLNKTPLWPGDKTFIRMAMLDENLWFKDVNEDRYQDMDLESYLETIRPSSDRFSHIRETRDNEKMDQDHEEWFGVRWKRGTDFITILQVNQKSSAGQAGLSRGDQILAINGKSIKDINTRDNATLNGLFNNYKIGTTISLDILKSNGAQMKLGITIGKDIIDPPLSRVFTTAEGRKIGYLYLDSFNTAQFREIRNHFNKFSKEQIRDLVLDLRYNGGGLVSNASKLGSLIAGQTHEGKEFFSIEYSQRYRDRNNTFAFKLLPESLQIQRLVVLTTKETCSASEVIINCLRPYLPVYTVGSTSCGKPYEMDVLEFGDKILYPVTARVVNSRGEGDYTYGIRADYRSKDDPTHRLGDPQEGMLKKALEILENVMPQI